MKTMLYRLAELAAAHGYATLFVRAFHALTGGRYALQPLRVPVRQMHRR